MTGTDNSLEDLNQKALGGDVEAVRNIFHSRYQFPPPLMPVKSSFDELFDRILEIPNKEARTVILKAFVNCISPWLDDKSWWHRYEKLRGDKAKDKWTNLSEIWYKAFNRVLKKAMYTKVEVIILLASAFRMWFELASDKRAYALWQTGLKVKTAGKPELGETYLDRAIGDLAKIMKPEDKKEYLASLQKKTTGETPHRMQAYCVKCRAKREGIFKPVTLKNGRPATQAICPVCGTKMFRIGKNGGSTPPPSPPPPPEKLEALRSSGEIKVIITHRSDKDELLSSLEAITLGRTMRTFETEIQPKPMERYINLWFTSKRADEARITKEKPLIKGQTAYMRVQIAPYDLRTILEHAIPFPDQEEIEHAHPELMGKSIPLDVTLFSNDFEILESERTQKLVLNYGQPTEKLYFQVRPLILGISGIRLCVFYQNHLLQSLSVTASSVEREGITTSEAQHAWVEMSFSADFTNVAQMKPRRLWLGINSANEFTHNLNIKQDNIALNRRLRVTEIEEALNSAHEALLDVAFVRGSDKTLVQYRYDGNNRPGTDDNPLSEEEMKIRFKEDIVKLACAGSYLFQAVLGSGAIESGEDAATVNPVVESIKKRLLEESEKIIQVTRLKAIKDIWPWSLMYDLQVDAPRRVIEVCMAFRNGNGKAQLFQECIRNCQHRDVWKNGNKAVVCPYGFWGFRHIIEQPYRHYEDPKKAFNDLPGEIKTGQNPVLKMPVETNLIAEISNHRTEMENLDFEIISSHAAIEDACKMPPEPHIMYFFCHSVHEPGINPYLLIGNDETLLSSELDTWKLNWEKTHALVFINGCQTVDFKPESLSMIMSPFVNAGVSGIIGTETAVHISLASEFAHKFFQKFLPQGAKGAPAGEIIRDIRLELLGKYNPLGLVYTPFCSADLSINKE